MSHRRRTTFGQTAARRTARLAVTLAVAVLALLVATVDTTAAWATGAQASSTDGLTWDVVGACPDAAAVRDVLAGLVSAGEARALKITIRDRGPQYRIAVDKDATTLDDPARDCAARARYVAVIVANALPPHRQVLGPPKWTIEKGLVFDYAPSAGSDGLVYGAEFRGAYGSERWSLMGSAGVRSPLTMTFEHDWKADVLRVPLDAGGRLTMHRGRFRPWVALGPSLTVTGIVGQNLVQTDRVWRLDVGALAMAGATLRVTQHLGVAAAIAVRWQPRPYQLQVAPLGTVGETPRWWIGLSLDYTLDGAASSP